MFERDERRLKRLDILLAHLYDSDKSVPIELVKLLSFYIGKGAGICQGGGYNGRGTFSLLGTHERTALSFPKLVPLLWTNEKWRYIESIACGCEFVSIYLAIDSRVYLFDRKHRSKPFCVSGHLKISKINRGNGYHHQFALIDDQMRVYTIGRNRYGQRGFENRRRTTLKKFDYLPKLVPHLNGTAIADVACGCGFNVFLSRDKRVFWSGRTLTGIDGDGDGDPGDEGRHVPMALEMNFFRENEIKIEVIDCGHSFAAFLDRQRRVWIQGHEWINEFMFKNHYSDDDECPYLMSELIDKELKIIEIAAGSVHLSLVDMNGFVWGVGDGIHGQMGNGKTREMNGYLEMALFPRNSNWAPTRIDLIRSGSEHVCARSFQGDWFAWGFNRDGQISCLSNGRDLKEGPDDDDDVVKRPIPFNLDSNEIIDVCLGYQRSTLISRAHSAASRLKQEILAIEKATHEMYLRQHKPTGSFHDGNPK